MNKSNPIRLIWMILAVIGILFIASSLIQEVFTERMKWSEVKHLISSGQVSEVVIDGDEINVSYKNTSNNQMAAKGIYIADDLTFIPLLEANNVNYTAKPKARWGMILQAMLVLALIGIGLSLLFQNQKNSLAGANMSKTKAMLADETQSSTRFSDVAGVNDALEELEEFVSFLKTPEKFTALGGKIPKGALLAGPPGTGKTLLAKAVAGEADVPFYHTSGSAFVEIYVGVGAARVRDLFDKAKENAPCIIFIDELDAIGKSRAAMNNSGNDEREQTLNQLLVAMDGFDSQNGVIIMAATNRPDALDPALLRPGRFDRQIYVGRPDLKGRLAILQVHTKDKTLGEDVRLETIAALTSGFSGADLANALNEAALLAARYDRNAITHLDIEEAIERTIAGMQHKSKRLNEVDKRIIAVHECGHAICAAAFAPEQPVEKISIIPRGAQALGYTLQRPKENQALMTKKDLYGRIVTLLGGRCAEEEVLGCLTTGAADDFAKATDLAQKMTQQFGMMTELGPIAYETETLAFLSDETKRTLESMTKDTLIQAQKDAKNILAVHKETLLIMAQTLQEKETLQGKELDNYLDQIKSVVV